MNKISTVILGLTLAALVSSVHAQTTQEQFRQMVRQLQETPNDDVLRERTIKLAQQIKPAPPIPEETQRRMARGTAALKGAKTENDYKEAVREFEKAALTAPWYADAYYNLGLAQDKAGDHGAAIRSLELALFAAPDSQETRNLMFEVEYRFIRGLDGGRWVCNDNDAYVTYFEAAGSNISFTTYNKTHRWASDSRPMGISGSKFLTWELRWAEIVDNGQTIKWPRRTGGTDTGTDTCRRVR